MGGKAFASHSPPLNTPRLTPCEYEDFREALVSRLSLFYERVATPIEAPDKESYGDIDIILSQPKYAVDQDGCWKSLSGAGAAKPVYDGIGQIAEDPYDHTDHAQIPVIEKAIKPVARIGNSFAVAKTTCAGDHKEAIEKAYSQVDVKIHSKENFAWNFFIQSHGDLWNMLGTSLRYVGLMLTDIGLCVINPTIEPTNKKLARIVLSREIDQVLTFLGLDVSEYWGTHRIGMPLVGEHVPLCAGSFTPSTRLTARRFESEEDLFRFACSSRFFMPEAYARMDRFKANDRKRLQARPSYSRFVKEWVSTKYPQQLASARTVLEEEEREIEAASTTDKEGRVHKGTTLRTKEVEMGTFSPLGKADFQTKKSRALIELRKGIADIALEQFGKRSEWDERESLFLTTQQEQRLKNVGRTVTRAEDLYKDFYANEWQRWLKGTSA